MLLFYCLCIDACVCVCVCLYSTMILSLIEISGSVPGSETWESEHCVHRFPNPPAHNLTNLNYFILKVLFKSLCFAESTF